MTTHSIDIRAASDNPETALHLVFGKKVSGERVIGCVAQIVEERKRYGLISEEEAAKIMKDATDKIEALENETGLR